MAKKLIQGWGINDAQYEVTRNVKAGNTWRQVWMCPVYSIWKGMISRSLSDKWHKHHPSYLGVKVCDEWRYFSNFRDWVLNVQPNTDWENCELDKDLLILNNKVYSPETCVFISRLVNTFLTDRTRSRGSCIIGVNFHSRDFVYEAHCCNPFAPTFQNRSIYLGRFSNELTAHKAWQAKKHDFACQLADIQDDPRVADALRQRYSPDKDWSKV